MSVTYQVAGGGHLDIDFWVRRIRSKHSLSAQVTDPRLAPMYTLTRKDTGTYSFTAEIECVVGSVNADALCPRCASVAWAKSYAAR